MRPSEAVALRDGHQRVTPPSTSTLAKIARAPDGGSQGKFIRFIAHELWWKKEIFYYF